MKKKFLSILLSLAMCLTLLPTAALAAEPTLTDITATGLRLGRDEAHPLPTEETTYKAGSGKVTYRPAAGSANAKLILDNATIVGTPEVGMEDGYAIELALPENTKFDVEVKGTNTLNSCLVIWGLNEESWYSPKPVEVTIQPVTGESNATLNVTHPCSQGTVDISGKLTIQGNINVSSKNTNPVSGNSAYAFWVRGDMTIQNGATVTAESNRDAVFFVDGVLSIDNATVTATNNGDGAALKAHTRLAVSNNAAVTATSNGSGRAVYIIGSQIFDGPTMGDALKIESGATLNATTKSGEAVRIGDMRTALVDNGTMNLAGGSSWFGLSTLTVQNNGKVTLASGSEMQITCDPYNGGGLTNNGSFENNGTLKFTGDAAPADGTAIVAMNLTGSGMVQLGADGEADTTYYTNSGTLMQGGSSDLDLTTLKDSDDLTTNGYALVTDATTGEKTLTLGSVRLGTITLPTDADTTIVLGGSAYAQKIRGGGALTVQKAVDATSAALTVSEGIELGGNLNIGSGVTLYAAGEDHGISFTNTSGSSLTIENGGALTAKRANGDIPAIFGVVTLPAEYYYRTTPNGSYLRGSLVACDPSRVGYVELVSSKPAGYTTSKVNYMAWDATNKQLKQMQCEVPKTVEASSAAVTWDAGWYVVEDNVTISGKVTVNGDVHLILADGKTLTTGIVEINNGSLTVYGQSAQSGKLTATGTISYGISVKNGTVLTVNGGVVEATGSNGVNGNSVGIQLGNTSNTTGTMTVNSGKVKAAGQDVSQTGISSMGISVNGQSRLTVNGGTVEATGGSAAQNAYSYGVYLKDQGTAVTINGGTLTAKATGEEESAVVVTWGSTLNLPADYWWRTATSGSYTRGKVAAYNPRGVGYVELVSSKPAGYTAAMVKYLDWNDTSKTLVEKTYEDPVPVTSSSTTLGASGKTTWYYVKDDVTIDGTVTVSGDVHLILCDGKTLTVNGGISGANASTALTLYGQSGGTGKLTVTGATSNAGISISGSLTVNGGKLSVNTPDLTDTGSGSVGVYGISVTDDMTVNGGTVTITAPEGSNVRNLFANKLTVNGGTMKLKESDLGNPVTVSNGVALADLLAAGQAYWKQTGETTGSFLKLAELTNPLNDAIASYSIKTCTYTAASGVCEYCGKDFTPAPTPSTPSVGSSNPTYTVTVPKTDNGSVSVTPKNAKKGASVTITVTPDSGYTLETLTVLDRNGNEIELTDNGDGTYSFKMPAGKVEIKATFAEDNSMLNFFTDVPADTYYYDAVLWAAKNGITGGIDENHFGPDRSCIRAQLVTFLWRAAGCPVVNFATDFTDVGDGYYTEAIRWAASLGIVGGYGSGLFGTDDTITREQFVTILYRFAKNAGMDVSIGEDTNILSYGDVLDVSEYAVEAFQWAVGAGIVQGNNGNLMPGQPCTRAQIVTMLYRLMGE